jgi:hypothetical protein
MFVTLNAILHPQPNTQPQNKTEREKYKTTDIIETSYYQTKLCMLLLYDTSRNNPL